MPQTATETVKRAKNRQREARQPRFRLQDYALILKPRVMSLVVFTAFVGLLLAPGAIDPRTASIPVLCIALGAGASGTLSNTATITAYLSSIGVNRLTAPGELQRTDARWHNGGIDPLDLF